MIALLTAFFKAACGLFELLKYNVYYGIRDKSRQRQKQLEEQIEKFRNIGDSNSTDRADLLRQELLTERRELEYLSALYAPLAKGSSDSNP